MYVCVHTSEPFVPVVPVPNALCQTWNQTEGPLKDQICHFLVGKASSNLDPPSSTAVAPPQVYSRICRKNSPEVVQGVHRYID